MYNVGLIAPLAPMACVQLVRMELSINKEIVWLHAQLGFIWIPQQQNAYHVVRIAPHAPTSTAAYHAPTPLTSSSQAAHALPHANDTATAPPQPATLHAHNVMEHHQLNAHLAHHLQLLAIYKTGHV